MTGDEIRPSHLHWWWFAGALAALGAAVLAASLFGAVHLDASSVVASLFDRLPFVAIDPGLTEREDE